MRRITIILGPLWLPLCLVGMFVGMLWEIVARGIREGREVIAAYCNAWRGPVK